MIHFHADEPRAADRMWDAEQASIAPFCIGRGLDPGAGRRTLRASTIRVDLFREYEPHLVADALRLPVRDESLDYVANSHLIEHLPFPRAAILEWLRAVKPGGHVAMVVPDTRFTRGMNTDPTPHLYEWAPEDFQDQVLGWPQSELAWYERRSAITWAKAECVQFAPACPQWSFCCVLRKAA